MALLKMPAACLSVLLLLSGCGEDSRLLVRYLINVRITSCHQLDPKIFRSVGQTIGSSAPDCDGVIADASHSSIGRLLLRAKGADDLIPVPNSDKKL